MHWTRTRDAPLKQDLPLLDFCTAEVRRVDRQIRSMRKLRWWYSAPIFVGCCVLCYGILSAVPELPSHTFYKFLARFTLVFLPPVVPFIAAVEERSSRSCFLSGTSWLNWHEPETLLRLEHSGPNPSIQLGCAVGRRPHHSAIAELHRQPDH